MKKSGQVRLTLLAAIAMAGCGRPYNPCREQTFNPLACQEAISSGGYYYDNSWYPMSYGHPYGYYYNRYYYFRSSGGTVRSAPSASYSHPSGVTRGGFGSTAHGSSGA